MCIIGWWIHGPEARNFLAQRRRLRRIVTFCFENRKQKLDLSAFPTKFEIQTNPLNEPLLEESGWTYKGQVLSCCLPKYPSPETAFSRNSSHWNCCFLTRSSLNRSNNRASLYRSLLPKWFHLFWKIVILFIEVKRWFWAFFAPKQENVRNFTFQLRFVTVTVSFYKKMWKRFSVEIHV